ncbi:Uma2 family endonuclease [Sphaerospermopsis sp. LEGE 08334]|uniref:Uma2 family endonuclease n=1 Tax=Sphaerospermopsis sp. LEGE 08334 TaxID=1828651 RepID=UPI0018816A28|nr:Uma2 family endonuclease [Sphaerospermopsis sp. LEGE 08334]MBE9056043.1 Uma2 family endonuclease [Sphaerospermopsis sp. LEGE 08334]
MVAVSDRFYMTPQEFLQWEASQEIKHEYLDGEVIAMIGGTIPHAAITLNLASALKNHLRGSKCTALMSDAKVGVSENGPFFYPDVVVSCHPQDKQAIKFLQFPCLIIEVLSPGTEAYDRGKKFQQYRNFSSLQEYVLIDSQRVALDCFRVNDRGFWELHPFVEGDEVVFTSVDFSFPFSLVYENVVLV